MTRGKKLLIFRENNFSRNIEVVNNCILTYKSFIVRITINQGKYSEQIEQQVYDIQWEVSEQNIHIQRGAKNYNLNEYQINDKIGNQDSRSGMANDYQIYSCK